MFTHRSCLPQDEDDSRDDISLSSQVLAAVEKKFVMEKSLGRQPLDQLGFGFAGRLTKRFANYKQNIRLRRLPLLGRPSILRQFN